MSSGTHAIELEGQEHARASGQVIAFHHPALCRTVLLLPHGLASTFALRGGRVSWHSVLQVCPQFEDLHFAEVQHTSSPESTEQAPRPIDSGHKTEGVTAKAKQMAGLRNSWAWVREANPGGCFSVGGTFDAVCTRCVRIAGTHVALDGKAWGMGCGVGAYAGAQMVPEGWIKGGCSCAEACCRWSAWGPKWAPQLEISSLHNEMRLDALPTALKTAHKSTASKGLEFHREWGIIGSRHIHRSCGHSHEQSSSFNPAPESAAGERVGNTLGGGGGSEQRIFVVGPNESEHCKVELYAMDRHHKTEPLWSQMQNTCPPPPMRVNCSADSLALRLTPGEGGSFSAFASDGRSVAGFPLSISASCTSMNSMRALGVEPSDPPAVTASLGTGHTRA